MLCRETMCETGSRDSREPVLLCAACSFLGAFPFPWPGTFSGQSRGFLRPRSHQVSAQKSPCYEALSLQTPPAPLSPFLSVTSSHSTYQPQILPICTVYLFMVYLLLPQWGLCLVHNGPYNELSKSLNQFPFHEHKGEAERFWDSDLQVPNPQTVLSVARSVAT